MARAIATVGGVALLPGVSLNRRWYTREMLAGAVARAQDHIAGGGEIPLKDSFGAAREATGTAARSLTQRTHHGAEDDSTRIVGRITSMSLGEKGEIRYTADIADTEAGRTIAALVDTSDGRPPFLKGVSIRGEFTGKVRKVAAPDGKPAETADGLLLHGLDYTASPGVPGAGVDTFSWASDGQTETTERVLITESVQEAAVTFTEEAGTGGTQENAPPDGVLEALGVLLGTGDPDLIEADTPAMSKRKSGLSGSGRKWADPGYQADHKQRYDITTKDKALTAWRYINQASKAAKYKGAQLKQIKARIRAALKSFGVQVSTESALAGWTFETYQVSDAVAEYYGDPSRAGSWCINASNGEVNVTLSSYSMNPGDLDPILRKAVDGVCGALEGLDPDMDGDVDVDGVSGDSDTDGDGGSGESAPDDDPATESEPAQTGEEGPAPAGTEEGTEDSAMTETSTSESGAGAQAGLNAGLQKLVAETTATAVAAAFKARDDAKAEEKRLAKEKAEREEREKAARKTALTEALAELGIKIPAQAAGGDGTATETSEGASGDGDAFTEAQVTERVNKAVSDALTEFKQELVTSGIITPGRTGLAVREQNVDPDTAPSAEDLQKMPDDDFAAHLGAALNAATTTAA